MASLLTACGDASAPSSSTTPMLRAARASAYPVASATVRVLPGLDGATPSAINDHDLVVGGVASKAFRWDPPNGFHLLPVAPGTEFSFASAVNDTGVIIGTVGGHVWLWKPDGESHPLGNVGCTGGGINKWGFIVGQCVTVPEFFTYSTATFPWHAPAIIDSSRLGNYTSVSDDDWIGGTGDGAAPGPPFLVSPTHQYIGLHNHDGLPAIGDVRAVTLHGYAAGFDREGNCKFGQAVAWLAAPNQVFPEFRLGTCGQANGITHDWTVVGTGIDSVATPASQWAFVWVPGKGTQRLPGLGGANESSAAWAINELHHVVGTVTSNGVQHVVIWTLGSL
jgi:hypothetical protein